MAELQIALKQAVADGNTTAAAAIRAELEYARTADRRPEKVLTVVPPCYFNTGCCSFPDGDITGLEIADGEIRLVRWPGNLHELAKAGGGVDAHKRILETEKLDAVLAAVAEAPPPAPGAEEAEIRPA
jgi:hypothetical protein